jgi:hypothetical protein
MYFSYFFSCNNIFTTTGLSKDFADFMGFINYCVRYHF